MKKYQQYTIEDLCTPVFQYEKKILEGGKIVYEEIDCTPRTTGIRAMDDFLRILEKGIRNNDEIARTMQVKKHYLNGLVYLLTGNNLGAFVRAYEMHIVDQYLRYTNLTGQQIATKLGFGTVANLSQCIFKMHNQKLAERRHQVCHRGDVGRFLLCAPTEKQKNSWAE